MSDIQRWEVDGFVDGWSEDSDGEWVKFADAEAAIAAARAEWEANGPYFTSVVHGCCEEKETAYQQGQRDMLAKCIAALPPCGCGSVHMNCYRMYAVAALRALQEMP